MKDAYGIEPAAGGAVMMAAGPGGDGGAAERGRADRVRRHPRSPRRQEDPGHQGRPRDRPASASRKPRKSSTPPSAAIKEKVSKDEADQIKTKMEEAGATVTVK
jgi:large subunit ribosomal protein L7/L12